MTTKEHRSQEKTIQQYFYRLAYICDRSHNWDKYLNMIDSEERQHRRLCPDGVKCGLKLSRSIELFAVTSVFQRLIAPNGMTKPFIPEAADYFHVRQSIYAATAIAFSNRELIEKEFSTQEILDFYQIDYAKLNEDRNAD